MDFKPEILERFFNGKYSRGEYHDIKSIFTNYSKSLFLSNYLKKHWNEFEVENSSKHDSDHLLHQIHHRIRLEENNDRKLKFISVFQRVAAILIVPLLFSFFTVLYLQFDNDNTEYANSEAYVEIFCPMGARTSFKLPDGTTGFINSGSSLKYPISFSNGRNVVLTGEAYFDVYHDESNPFVVHTDNMQVKVLGTKFNVSAYSDAPEEEVVLSSGRVELRSVDGEVFNVLTPNQKLVLNTEENTFEVNAVEASEYTEWTEGKLVFRNEDLSQVAERLGRWYNADIVFENDGMYPYNFRATFEDETLDEVLKLIAIAAPISWDELPRDLTDTNSYQRRKILIQLDEKRMTSFK